MPGLLGYKATATNLRTNEVVYTDTAGTRDGLQPGESFCPKDGNGIQFDGLYFPTLFSIEFSTTRSDYFPDNNHYKEVYLIYGGGYMNVPSYLLSHARFKSYPGLFPRCRFD